MNEYTEAEREEINAYKRQLAENAAWRRDSLSEEETSVQPPTITEQQIPAVRREYESVKDTIAVGQQAALLEQSGIPYSVALKISEAVNAGDFEAAAMLTKAHENNERIAHAAEAEAIEEEARLRVIFGLA